MFGAEHPEFSRLIPNSYQDTWAYRLCTATSGCGGVYIVSLAYYVSKHSQVHDVPAVFIPLWAGIFMLCSALVTCLLHNNRSKLRLSLVLAILLSTFATCALGAFTSAYGSSYFKADKCTIYDGADGDNKPTVHPGSEFDFKDLVSEVVGDEPTEDGNDEIEDGVEVLSLGEEGKTWNSTCVCTISPLVMAPSNTVSVNTDSLGYCVSRLRVLRGLMMVTALVCVMTISFIFMQIMVVCIQLRSSTSLSEISNAIISGTALDLTSKYRPAEDLMEESTQLVQK